MFSSHGENLTMSRPSVSIEWIVLLLLIREFQGSNPDTSFYEYFRGFAKYLQANT
jgi:hypothetical protein